MPNCILGIIMLALPFLAVFIWLVIFEGWKVALAIYAVAAFIVIWIIMGAKLISHCGW